MSLRSRRTGILLTRSVLVGSRSRVRGPNIQLETDLRTRSERSRASAVWAAQPTARSVSPKIELNPPSLESFFEISSGLVLLPADGCKQIAKLWPVGYVTLLLGVLDEFFQHDLILRRQSVRPRIRAEDFFLFQNQHGARESQALGVIVGFPAELFRFRKRVQQACDKPGMRVEERLPHDESMRDREDFRPAKIFVDRRSRILEDAANARILGSKRRRNVRRNQRVDFAAQQQCFSVFALNDDLHAGRRLKSRALRLGCDPQAVLRPYVVILLENPARPQADREAVLIHTDFLSFQILRPIDAR